MNILETQDLLTKVDVGYMWTISSQNRGFVTNQVNFSFSDITRVTFWRLIACNLIFGRKKIHLMRFNMCCMGQIENFLFKVGFLNGG